MLWLLLLTVSFVQNARMWSDSFAFGEKLRHVRFVRPDDRHNSLLAEALKAAWQVYTKLSVPTVIAANSSEGPAAFITTASSKISFVESNGLSDHVFLSSLSFSFPSVSTSLRGSDVASTGRNLTPACLVVGAHGSCNGCAPSFALKLHPPGS